MSAHHHHSHNYSSGNTLIWALVITLAFATIEAISGWFSNSLALMGDAGHMLTDASALGLAAFAAWLSRHPPSHRHSYGLLRAEVLAALVNSLLMIAIVVAIAVTAINRLQQPEPVSAPAVIIIAAMGLVINIIVAWVLHRGEQTLNVRAAMLHVMGDLLGSAAALIAGIVIYFTQWYLIDPVLSLLICALILVSSARLLREAIHIIMEGVPGEVDLPQVGFAMAAAEGIKSVHDLHIWTLASGNIALSAHVVINDMTQWQPTLTRLQDMLEERFHIEHSTIQPELHEFIIQPQQPDTP
ncbi:cation diffusion facilitator family transporter [Pseudomonadota bacterium]